MDVDVYAHLSTWLFFYISCGAGGFVEGLANLLPLSVAYLYTNIGENFNFC
jgi:dihydrodipicolinate synthase/N-acetylneuraminate lyase